MNRSSIRGRASALARIAVALLAAFIAPACATRQLRTDFGTFSDAYATNMNWQMLLNLARLDQGHPAYFMAIGEIRLARTQSGSLQGTTNSSRTEVESVAANVSRTVTNVLSGNVVTSGQASASPTFVFIPINSEEAARQLLAPISIDVFNTLFQQGWPVDQLLRVLVERVEVSFDDPNRKPIVMTNSPTRGSPESFAQFIRTCEVVRKLQQNGGLSLVSEERFRAASELELDAARLTMRDLSDAADRNRTWQRTPDGRYQLGTMRTTYRFQADPTILTETLHALGLSDDPAGAAPTDPEARLYQAPLRKRELENLRAVLGGGLFVASTTSSENPSPPPSSGGARNRGAESADESDDASREPAPGRRDNAGRAAAETTDNAAVARPPAAADADASVDNGEARRRPITTVLILRSFRNVLEAVAQEQRAFDELARTSDFLAGLPARQQQPILRTDWSGFAGDLLRPVTRLEFAEHEYQVTDPAGLDPASLDARWNRDVFRLLVNLSSQVTVDITKFQRQVLELTQ